MVNYLEKGIKGTFIVAFFTILASFFGYLTRLFLARTISPEEFGLFYAVFTLFMFASVFTDLGYGTALVKFVSEFMVQKKKDAILKTVQHVFLVNIIMSMVLGFVFLFISDFLAASYFKTGKASPLILIFVPILIFNTITGFFHSILQSFQKMFKYGVIYFMSKFLFFVLCIVFFYLGLKGSMMPGIAFLISVILLFILFVKPVYSEVGSIKSRGFDKNIFLKLTRFAIPNLLTAIAGTVIGYIDTLILTYLVPLEEVGVYNAVLPTVLLLGYLTWSLGVVLFPMVSELLAGKKCDELKKIISIIYRYTLLIIIPLAALLFFFSEQALQLLFGPNFISGTEALRILCIGVIFLSIAQINFSILNGAGKPKEITKIIAAAALLNVVLNFILIPIMGISGAALSTTLSYLLMMLWSYFAARKSIPFNIEKAGRITLAVLIFILSFYAFQKLLNSMSMVNMIFICAVAGLIYMFSVFILGIAKPSDFKLLIKIFLKKMPGPSK